MSSKPSSISVLGLVSRSRVLEVSLEKLEVSLEKLEVSLEKLEVSLEKLEVSLASSRTSSRTSLLLLSRSIGLLDIVTSLVLASLRGLVLSSKSIKLFLLKLNSLFLDSKYYPSRI